MFPLEGCMPRSEHFANGCFITSTFYIHEVRMHFLYTVFVLEDRKELEVSQTKVRFNGDHLLSHYPPFNRHFA